MARLWSLLLGIVMGIVGLMHPLPAAQAPAQPTPSIDTQLHALAPQAVLDAQKYPGALQVQYLPADLDGSGRNDYIVAAYEAGPPGGKLVVFRDASGTLTVAGGIGGRDQLEIEDNGVLRLTDIDGSGVPVVEVDNTSDDGQNVTLHLFRWTGSGLVSLIPAGTDTANAYLVHIGGNASMSLVVPPYCDGTGCEGFFTVYDLKNGRYTVAATSTGAPE